MDIDELFQLNQLKSNSNMKTFSPQMLIENHRKM